MKKTIWRDEGSARCRLRRAIAVALAFGFATVTCGAAGPHVEVVLAADASRVTRFAATEMQEFLGEALGREVPVVSVPTDGRTHLHLGESPFAGRAGVTAEGLPRDAFRIVVRGQDVFIVGKDDPKVDPERAFRGLRWENNYERGTLFGVYEFLERFVGVRFYFPGELGTVVPKLDGLRLSDADLTSAPYWISRRHKHMTEGVWHEGRERDCNATMRSRWLNAYRLREETSYVPFGHGLILKGYVERFAKTHPEYFLLQEDGTRATRADVLRPCHVCLTSGIWDEVFKDVRSYFRGESASVRGIRDFATGKVGFGRDFQLRKYVDIMPQDDMPRCHCANCKAAYDTDDPNDFADTILWSKTAEVGRRLLDEGLGGYLTQMSYPPYARVPKVELPTNIVVEVAVMGPWAERDPGHAKADLDLIRAWADKVGNKVWLWTYPLMFMKTAIPDVPKYAPHAWGRFYKSVAPYARGTFAETSCDRFLFDQMNLYVYSKVAWDPSVDVEALLEEYYRLMFGPGAREMAAFGDAIERKWVHEIVRDSAMDAGGPTGNDVASDDDIWGRIYSPAERARLRALLDAARDKTAAGSIERRRVELMRRELFDPLEGAAARHVARKGGDKGSWRFGSKGPMRLTPFAIDRYFAAVNDVKTTARAWIDGEKLVVRVLCGEPYMDKRWATPYKVRNYRLFNEDCVELMINPNGDRKTVCHFGVNSAGAYADEIPGRTTDPRPNFTARVEDGDSSWTATFEIPLATLPGLKDEFPAEIVRRRHVRFTYYSQPEYYHWSPLTKGPRDVANYGIWSVK